MVPRSTSENHVNSISHSAHSILSSNTANDDEYFIQIIKVNLYDFY